ncbi:HIT domain-containing protein [Aestuariimicrobium sp. T2.26MG-19.2B]|uniref:HIT domain-containing protein n=1 Tax=Aestuariimicrobium sp. T2.26MG-19.2B TaxID=3040679 RepID=UPI00406BE1E3
MPAMTCVFCAIVAGSEPATIVAANEGAVAFLTLPSSALSAGHTLVVPSSHSVGLLDTAATGREAVINLCHAVALAMVDAGIGTGVNLLSASGPGSDQSVDHWHVHVVARRAGDGIDTWPETASPVARKMHAEAGLQLQQRLSTD